MELTAFNSMHAISREQTKVARSKARRSSVEVLCDARRDIMQLKESQAELENELLNIRLKETDNILEGVQDHDLENALHELEQEALAAAEVEAQQARALNMVTARAVKKASLGGYVGTGKHKAKIDVEARVDSHNAIAPSAKSFTSPASKPSGTMLQSSASGELMPHARRGSMLAMLNHAEATAQHGQHGPAGGRDSPPPLSPSRLQHGKSVGSPHTYMTARVSGGNSASGAPPSSSYFALEPLSPMTQDKAHSFSAPLPPALTVPRGGHSHSRTRHLGSTDLLNEAAFAACQLAKPVATLTSHSSSTLLSGSSSLLNPSASGGGAFIRGALSSLVVPSNMLSQTKQPTDQPANDLIRTASEDVTLVGSMAESKGAPKAGRRAGKPL